jgi:uncharacterized membrane protein (DUF373 family)
MGRRPALHSLGPFGGRSGAANIAAATKSGAQERLRAPRRRAAGAGSHALAEPHTDNEPLVRGLHWVIRMSVRALAILMTGVIAFGVADVVCVLYRRRVAESRGFLQISDILATFGTFMAVLIAIEIFLDIISYLREDVIHVCIVLATAMMAIARKVIILDYSTTSPQYIYAAGTVVAAMALAFWTAGRFRRADVPESA